MTTLTELRADVAGRVRARLAEAERLEPVVTDVRDAHPPCVLVGLVSARYTEGRAVVPVILLAPGPGNRDAAEWLEGCLSAITAAGPLGPYSASDADANMVDIGDRSFPSYELQLGTPMPRTYCGNRLPPMPVPPPLPDLTVAYTADYLTVTITVTADGVTVDPDAVDWGDGTIDTALVHTYVAAGTYTIFAEAVGYTDGTVTVTVAARQLTVTVLDVTDLTVMVDVTGEDPDLPVDLTWGDGTVDVDLFEHTYTAGGTFTIAAAQVAAVGDTVDVTVTQRQLAIAVTDQTDLTVTVDVTGEAPGVPVAMAWGDGDTDVDVFTHTYTVAGTFTVAADQTGALGITTDVTVTEPEPPPNVFTTWTPTYYGFEAGSYTLNKLTANLNVLVVLYGPGKTPLATLPSDAGGALTPAVVGLTWTEVNAAGATQVAATGAINVTGTGGWTSVGNPVTWLYYGNYPTTDHTLTVSLLDAGGATVHTYPTITLT